MLLSVIVPVYNMAADGKLSYCLDSLVGQTLQDLEIIAVDDASTDDSLAVLHSYKARYPDKVKVIHSPVNRRQGGARNLGLDAAQGEWIGFVDSDDWVAPDAYEKLLAKAKSTGADMVGCDYSLVHTHTMEVGQVIVNNTADQTGLLDEDKHRKLILRSGSMVIKIYSHRVITAHGLCFPEGIFYEDNCAGPLWSLYFQHFEKVEEPLYYYYQHQASTVHVVTEQRCEDRMKAEELFWEECKKRGFFAQYFPEIEYRFTELYYVNTLFSYMLGSRRPKLSFVRKLRKKQMTYFPDFAKNPYYQQLTDAEEKEMIALQSKSDLAFYGYYRLKWAIRKKRKKWRRT